MTTGKSSDFEPTLKTFDCGYKSLSVFTIDRQALARARLIQPPLSHLTIEPVKAEHRGIDSVTSAR
jgi:hypothetical protein